VKLGPALAQTVRHFFPQLNDWLQALPDTRQAEACTYETRFLAWWGIGLYLFGLKSRRQADFRLDARGTAVLTNFNRLAGTQQTTRPVHGTLDHFVGHVVPEGFATVRTRLVRQLIRSKVLDPARLLGHLVAPLDATGQFAFRQRHCPHCLTQRHGETTVYFHEVLEAKVLGPADLVFSLASVFLENRDAQTPSGPSRGGDAAKQDCELKAFSRLAPLLKQDFPQLRLCLAVDALYACGRFFQICRDNHWSFVCTFTPGALPTAWDEFQRLLPLCPQNRLERHLPDGTRQLYRWVPQVGYTDSEGRPWAFHAIQLEETVGDQTTTFAWLTPLPVGARTVEAIATQGGRHRWKIENQGFNRQKNSDLNLQHLFSTDPEKLKAYYYLLQIACILLQLLEQGSLLRRLAQEYGRTPWQLFGSLKNVAWLLLESIRCYPWPSDCFTPAAARLRIRFALFNSS
jgi:hypothetical protein